MNRSVVALVVAVVLGIFAVLLVNDYLERAQHQGSQTRTMEIAMARTPLRRGTVLGQEHLLSRTVDASLVWDKIIPWSRRNLVLGAVINRDVAANSPLEQSFFVESGEQEFYTGAEIAEGMRLVSLGLSPVRAAGGMLPPESRVDVLATVVRPGEGAAGETAATKVLLANVRVFAVNPGRNARSGEQQLVVVLEVLPREAQLLAFAIEQGQGLILLRRNPQDKGVLLLEPVSKFNLFELGDQVLRDKQR